MEDIRKTKVFNGEHMLNNLKRNVFRLNQWKTFGKLTFSMGTNGKHYENTCFQMEPIGNNRKTHIFSGNGNQKENMCFLLKPMESIRKTNVFRENQWNIIRKQWFSMGT